MTQLFFLQAVFVFPSFFWIFPAVILIFLAYYGYACFNMSLGVYLSAFCRKHTREKLIALTFDDGPHPEHTYQVLDVLKKNDVKATFFVIGKNIAGNEAVLKKIYSDGHQIGVHSFSHRNIFPFSGKKKIAADLLQCEQAIVRTTGYKPTWFRPPFGVTNPDVAKAVNVREYKVAAWNIRSFDTVISNKNKIVKRVVSRLSPGAVVLLHDRLPHTPDVLEHIIRKAVEMGYGFVTVEQMFVK
jgi:peptidoglycan/xylan/chitin deacetylase (PgdA/CDA1 family)